MMLKLENNLCNTYPKILYVAAFAKHTNMEAIVLLSKIYQNNFETFFYF